MSTAVCVCGKEFEQESPVHTHCSPECYSADSERNRSFQIETSSSEVDRTQWLLLYPDEALHAEFPRVVAIAQYAESFGPCRLANWDNVLAHAHTHDGIICVKGAASNLWDTRGPTSLFLHEYAHLELPDEWHTPRFAEVNKELHRKYGVMHDKKAEAIGSVALSIIIIVAGITLYVTTGWGWIGIGAGISLLMTLPWVFNSFQEEQIAAHEHDMREGKGATTAAERKARGGIVVPFTSTELPYIKEHGLRALCGLLMDRHSACTVCPFCGHHDPSDELADVMQLIVHVEAQVDAHTGNPLVALYFSKAVLPDQGDAVDPVKDWGAQVTYAEDVPTRKAVVNLLDNGAYHAQYGPITNPTSGDHSTGALDRTEWTLAFHCDPEPRYTKWRYWESGITPEQTVVPEFLCLRLRGEWWVIDRDREQVTRLKN